MLHPIVGFSSASFFAFGFLTARMTGAVAGFFLGNRTVGPAAATEEW